MRLFDKNGNYIPEALVEPGGVISCHICKYRHTDECNPDDTGYTLRDECGECPGDIPVETTRVFGEFAELYTFEEGDPI